MDADTRRWEARLAQVAAGLPYPPTPDLVAGFRRRTQPARTAPQAWRRRAVAVAVAALVLAGILLAAPPVRAALARLLRIGAVEVHVVESGASTPVTPADNALPVLDPEAIAGETSLDAVQEALDFPLALPAALGPPSRVYLQKTTDSDLNGDVAILVWLDKRTGRAQLTLYAIDAAFYGLKRATTEIVRETRVNGETAFWIAGPHPIRLRDGSAEEWYLIAGNVLLWSDGRRTYRLESGLALDEALAIAETIGP